MKGCSVLHFDMDLSSNLLGSSFMYCFMILLGSCMELRFWLFLTFILRVFFVNTVLLTRAPALASSKSLLLS